MKYTGILTTLCLVATSFTAASPVDSSKRDSSTMAPSATYRRWIKSGEIKAATPGRPLVVKDGIADHETTAIVTFNFGQWVDGRTCKLVFNLGEGDTSTGSQNLDVFSTYSPPRFSRDQQLGRIHTTVSGPAEWIMSYHGMPEFPCPAGELMGVEFVGVGDRDTVGWQVGETGPKVQVL